MPIERGEFEVGETHDAVMSRVEKFLASHSTRAYSAEEVAVAINHPAGATLPGVNELQSAYRVVQRLAFVSLLDLMAIEKKIERRLIHTAQGPETFYASRR